MNKRQKLDPDGCARNSTEVRASATGGHGLFAASDIGAGSMVHDHPICVPCRGTPSRQLPRAECIDDLMQEVAEGAAAGNSRFEELMRGPKKLTHVPAHFEMQDEAVELPQWALDIGLPACAYNMLAAQLQSNIARDATGDALCLNPLLRFANHACDPNTEIGYHPDADSALGGVSACKCGVGCYVLRAKRRIVANEELCFNCAPIAPPRLSLSHTHTHLTHTHTHTHTPSRSVTFVLSQAPDLFLEPSAGLARPLNSLFPVSHTRSRPLLPSLSDIGEHVLAGAEEREQRRALLHRRWGFWCECTLCVRQDPQLQSAREAAATEAAVAEAAVIEATEAPQTAAEARAEEEAEAAPARSLRPRAAAPAQSVAPAAHPVHGSDTGLLPED